MTISPEAKEAATAELLVFYHPSIYDTHERGHYVQLAINSATAPLQKEIDKWKASHDNQVKLRRMLMDRPDLKERAKLVSGLTEENQKLQKEIERLRGEVEKAFNEGWDKRDSRKGMTAEYWYNNSRAKRVAEGKE